VCVCVCVCVCVWPQSHTGAKYNAPASWKLEEMRSLEGDELNDEDELNEEGHAGSRGKRSNCLTRDYAITLWEIAKFRMRAAMLCCVMGASWRGATLTLSRRVPFLGSELLHFTSCNCK